MYKNLATALRAACVSALAGAVFISPVFSQTTPNKGQAAEPVKAGFVYVSPITEAGWTRQHDEGRKAVEAALGSQVKTTFVENVAEGADAERVIRDLAATGHQIIFTPIRISVAALRQFLRRNVKMREKIFRHSSPPRTQNMPLKTADCVLRASAVKKFQN